MNTYRSRRDWWIVGLLWLSIGALLLAFAIVWTVPGPPLTRWVTSGLLFVSAAFTLHVLEGTAYDVSDENLVVRSGPFHWTIPIQNIISVKPSRSLLSGPALSLDRLHVAHRRSRWGVLISPENVSAFLADLAERSPHLEVVDGTIRRTGPDS